MEIDRGLVRAKERVNFQTRPVVKCPHGSSAPALDQSSSPKDRMGATCFVPFFCFFAGTAAARASSGASSTSAISLFSLNCLVDDGSGLHGGPIDGPMEAMAASGINGALGPIEAAAELGLEGGPMDGPMDGPMEATVWLGLPGGPIDGPIAAPADVSSSSSSSSAPPSSVAFFASPSAVARAFSSYALSAA